MLANLLTALDANAIALWLGGLLLALGFRRNRYALIVGVYAIPLFATTATAGILLATALLGLLVTVLPEPPLRSWRSAAIVLAAVLLPTWVPATALAPVLDQIVLNGPVATPRLGWAAWLVIVSAAFALLRWLRRGWPLDLYLAISLLPAIVAFSSNPPISARAWWAASSAAFGIAVLYGAYRMAFIDALTGLANRRALDERLARSQGRIAIAMVDVDHFKRFNDRYGHESGDQVLRAVARQLQRCRGGDAYRYGGEEFAIVFQGRQVERASEALEGVRTSIEALRVRLRRGGGSGARAQAVRRGQHDGEVGVTVSIGLAERDPERRTCNAIVDAADKALYRSKQRGRNRLTLAGAAR